MTLDEAIKHCKEKAEELKNQYGELANKRPEPIEEQMRLLQEKHDCLACANEHEQLANWLEDYKRLLEERTQGDLISREALKKCAIPCQIHNGALTDLCVPLYQIDNAPVVETKTIHDVNSAYDRGFITAMKAYSKPQGEWIPVSDRLPEINKEVIVTDIETSNTYQSRYIGNGYWECDNGTLKNRIIAWMPLPEPYKGEGSAE